MLVDSGLRVELDLLENSLFPVMQASPNHSAKEANPSVAPASPSPADQPGEPSPYSAGRGGRDNDAVTQDEFKEYAVPLLKLLLQVPLCVGVGLACMSFSQLSVEYRSLEQRDTLPFPPFFYCRKHKFDDCVCEKNTSGRTLNSNEVLGRGEILRLVFRYMSCVLTHPWAESLAEDVCSSVTYLYTRRIARDLSAELKERNQMMVRLTLDQARQVLECFLRRENYAAADVVRTLLSTLFRHWGVAVFEKHTDIGVMTGLTWGDEAERALFLLSRPEVCVCLFFCMHVVLSF